MHKSIHTSIFFTYYKGYSVYADGKIEQYINIAANWTDGLTVTLPITHTSTPAITGTMSNTATISYSGTPKIFNKGTSSFRISANQSGEILYSSLSFSVIGY